MTVLPGPLWRPHQELLRHPVPGRRRSLALLAAAAMLAALVSTATPARPALAALGADAIATIAGTGASGYGGDGESAVVAKLRHPNSVVVDHSTNLYISGDNRIRKVDASGTISTVAGNGYPRSTGDGGPASAAQLNGAGGMAMDRSGNLYIAEFFANKVRKIDTSGIVTTVAGSGARGYSGDGAPAAQAQLDVPVDVAVDGSGNLFIADTGNNRIRRVDTSGVISTVAGSGDSGFSGDGQHATAARLDSPNGVAVDAGGNLYVTDTGNWRVRRVDASGVITTVAGDGTAGVYDGDRGDGGQATLAQLGDAHGIGVDESGAFYFAELNSHRVRKVSASGTITTVAGTGLSSYGGDGGRADQSQLAAPYDVAADRLGNLFIADLGNHRLRRVGREGLVVQTADQPDPAVAATSSAGPWSATNGEVVTYTLRVTNFATTSATGVVLNDTLPSQSVFRSATASQGLCSTRRQKVMCKLGNMRSTAVAEVRIEVGTTAPGVMTNKATVESKESDPYTPTNTTTARTTVSARSCGRIITENTVLTEDIGPCGGDGVVLGAENVTLNLNGHRVFGFQQSADGNSAGIRLTGRSGITVTNGTVSGFDAGVVLVGGSSNTLAGLTVSDNVGLDDPFNAELGDGIVLFNSSGNRIANNTVVRNGIFDGIGVLGPLAQSNTIEGNIVEDNIGPSDGGPAGQGIIVNAAGLGDNDGRTIANTSIVGNEVRRNASGGLTNVNSVEARILANTVEDNGSTNSAGNGIGIQLGPLALAGGTTTLVKDNKVYRNGFHGIHIRERAVGNQILDNDARENNARNELFFDLHDGNGDCTRNVWSGNTRVEGGRYSPECTVTGETGATLPEPPSIPPDGDPTEIIRRIPDPRDLL